MCLDAGKFLIKCGEWVHGECVGLSSSQGLRMEKCGENYLCPLCDPQTWFPMLDANQSAMFIWGSGLNLVNAFNFLNWYVSLHNIHFICPPLAFTLPADLLMVNVFCLKQ